LIDRLDIIGEEQALTRGVARSAGQGLIRLSFLILITSKWKN
jgi:hypothetical protein